MNNITKSQWFQIIGIIIGAIIASSSLWTQLFGNTTAQVIVSVTGFVSTIASGVGYILTGQGQMVKDVAAMPGIQSITVDSGANQNVAQVAVDEAQPKVNASPAAEATVQQTAKGA